MGLLRWLKCNITWVRWLKCNITWIINDSLTEMQYGFEPTSYHYRGNFQLESVLA